MCVDIVYMPSARYGCGRPFITLVLNDIAHIIVAQNITTYAAI